MNPIEQHTQRPDISFDGGDLDCENGLLLLIRKQIDPMPRGSLLEIAPPKSRWTRTCRPGAA